MNHFGHVLLVPDQSRNMIAHPLVSTGLHSPVSCKRKKKIAIIPCIFLVSDPSPLLPTGNEAHCILAF